MAHTIDCVCSKILNHGLNHGLLFSLFKFFWVKDILNQLENSGLKSRLLFCLIFQFYLMYRLICHKPAHFLSAQIALVSTFFQMFIVCTWDSTLVRACIPSFQSCLLLILFIKEVKKRKRYVSSRQVKITFQCPGGKMTVGVSSKCGENFSE